MDTSNGLLEQARQVPSPNCDERPEGCQPELIVIHNISLPPGEFGGAWIDDLFTNCLDPRAHPYFAGVCGLRVSAHALIRRDGEIVQYVPFHHRAWHAGASVYEGRQHCNDFAIGIELEGDDETPYDDRQYEMLTPVLVALLNAYPGLSAGRIAGHADIAPGRKTDPGSAFDWERMQHLLKKST
ncbi:MAG: 1,6-anhydro-N-acetylmuramyl-L-alanine amidase AmpD [Gammaproteobacteria bacterium]